MTRRHAASRSKINMQILYFYFLFIVLACLIIAKSVPRQIIFEGHTWLRECRKLLPEFNSTHRAGKRVVHAEKIRHACLVIREVHIVLNSNINAKI